MTLPQLQHIWRWATIALGPVVGSCLTACGKDVIAPPPTICPVVHHPDESPPTAADWLGILLRFQRDRPSHDCLGSPLRYQPPSHDCPELPPETQPRPITLSASSIFEQELRSQRRLVWIVTHRFDGGDGFGPIALVQDGPSGTGVRALGALRLPTEHVAMATWAIADHDVIVVRGERCSRGPARDQASGECVGEHALLLQDGPHLVLSMIQDEAGKCLGAARLPTLRIVERQGPTGATERVEMRSILGHDPRYVVLTEQGVVSDVPADASGGEPRVVRSTELQRFLHPRGGRLISRQHSLWPQLLGRITSTGREGSATAD